MGPGMARAGSERRGPAAKAVLSGRALRLAATHFALFCSCRGVLPRYKGYYGTYMR